MRTSYTTLLLSMTTLQTDMLSQETFLALYFFHTFSSFKISYCSFGNVKTRSNRSFKRRNNHFRHKTYFKIICGPYIFYFLPCTFKKRKNTHCVPIMKALLGKKGIFGEKVITGRTLQMLTKSVLSNKLYCLLLT